MGNVVLYVRPYRFPWYYPIAAELTAPSIRFSAHSFCMRLSEMPHFSAASFIDIKFIRSQPHKLGFHGNLKAQCVKIVI